eukprot:Sspe_Gene.38789::Locus_18709_Transcript_1_1_Confidence_1.000_Length_1278::g.38789::m.38789/K18584/ACTR3, ARP3; actin-related protein 3
MDKPAIVMDNGTGFTKIGYGGNLEPSFVFPTCIAEPPAATQKLALDDQDFYIGHDAHEAAAFSRQKYQVFSPIQHGIIENWDQMEKIWQHSIYKYLRCEPSEHAFLLTEPPLNPPENRELMAEVMFETFGVAALNIAVQAVLALWASRVSKKAKEAKVDGSMTGTVIDSGDGVTHIIPVYEGCVIHSGIKHLPFAGKDITRFYFNFIKEREKIDPEVNFMEEAQKIKEQHGYVSQNICSEFQKFDSDPAKHLRKWSGTVPKSKATWEIDIGPERFLGPELFFHPELYQLGHTTPLPELIDETIMGCPVDCRRGLYKDIVLSGGSTTFKNFGRRLERDIKAMVDARMELEYQRRRDKSVPKTEIEVNVITHKSQDIAVWLGGSFFTENETFPSLCKTKAMYDEHGPS